MFNEHQARAWPPRPNRAGGSGAARAPHLGRPGAMARVGLAVAALLSAGWPSTGRAATLSATLQSHVLSVADLPYGWSPAPVPSTKGQVTTSLCGAALVAVLSPSGVMSAPGLGKSPLGPDYSTASFVEGAGLPSLREALASGAQAEEAWQQLGTTFAGCRAATFVYKGTKAVATGDPLAFARLGRSSSAYGWTVRVAGAQTGSDVDVVLFQAANYYGYLSYLDVGPRRSPP